MKTTPLITSCFAAILALLCLSGCAGYQLGATLPPGIESVHVPVFRNESGEPQLEQETTRAAIAEFQKDGSLKVLSSAAADSRLDVVITDYKLKPVRYDPNRRTTSNEMRLILKTNIMLTRISDGEVVVNLKGVSGDTTFERVGSMSVAKQEALPKAARDLAHDIVSSVVEFW